MMWKPLYLISVSSLCYLLSSVHDQRTSAHSKIALTVDSTDAVILEPWTYREDFEDRDLGAWASYPLWQDIAYNQNFRVNEMVPGDSNISIVQKVTPYTAVDNYVGAQKLLDMYMVPGATLGFKYYFKAHQDCAWFKVRFAAGPYGKLDLTIRDIDINGWQHVTFSWDDLLIENPVIATQKKIKIYAVAFLAKFSKADPDMPIYFGLDDLILEGARPAQFRFSEPPMTKLPEFKPFIPLNHYYTGDEFRLSGRWSPEVKKVTLDIATFSDGKRILRDSLFKEDHEWILKPFHIFFDKGLYMGTLKAYDDINKISETNFTIHVAPKAIAGLHPRLLFDPMEKKKIEERLKQDRFRKLYESMPVSASKLRSNIPVESLQYDLDQFPEEEWLPSWDAWGARIYHTGTALRSNARAYAFHGDREAGEYVKQVLLELASWPDWTHPWQTKRGRFSEHRTGSWSHRIAEAYDLVYPLFNKDEGTAIRQAIMKNIVHGVHRTYIYNDNITAATSNWLAMTVGGSVMCLSAIFEDGEETQNIEPYFTGAILKLDRFLHKVTDSGDGGWGEGFGYNNYSLSNLSYSLPSLEHVFNIDLSKPLKGTYKEYLWAGLIKKKRWFEYGDSHGQLTSARNWAFLLSKYQEPQLSWFYHFLKDQNTDQPATGKSSLAPHTNHDYQHESYEDVVFNTHDIPQKNPFGEPPVKLFRDLGTIVFKSGWDPDDFVFVMRSGPAYNHQHMDQGSIWLADREKLFIEERPLGNSHYYDDPIYESWLTQPVGHSTILVDGNHQSQRVGDHLSFAPGFDDHARVTHFLDGKHAAFAVGDIGKLYWGKVSELSRNVLYIKPRIILMLDVSVPAEEDVKITLLHQTARLKDIRAGLKKSLIVKEDQALSVFHMLPEDMVAKAVETPHYLRTLQNGKPLEREGMLTLSSVTRGKPLIMANVLTTSKDPNAIQINSVRGVGCISGEIQGKKFAFSTQLDHIYDIEDFTTDALAITWDRDTVFVAKARLYQDPHLKISSDQPLTFEWSFDGVLKYYVERDANLTIGLDKKPGAVLLNGAPTILSYDRKAKALIQPISAGQGILTIR